MLIKALCDYYDIQADKEPSSLPEGYENQKIHYKVLLRENGEIAGICDIRSSEEIPQKNGKIKTVKNPSDIPLPQRSQKTAIYSALIEHRPLYLFGLNYDNKNNRLTVDAKAQKSHRAFVERNSEFFADLNSPVCNAFRSFINNFNPENEMENIYLSGLGKEYASSYFCFGLYDEKDRSSKASDITPQGDSDFLEKYRQLLREQNEKNDDAYKAVCSVTGQLLPTARIHDKIKFPGGNSTGCVLVGMKEPAYESYGKAQSYNSAISEEAMKKYTAAFNKLLADPTHRFIKDSLVIVFFAVEKDDSKEVSLFRQLFGVSEKGSSDKAFEDAILKMISGGNVNFSELGIDENADFYMAGFTPNAARISQKFFIHNSFGKIMANMAQHQRDMAALGSPGTIYFNWIFDEITSPKSKDDEVPPPLAASIFRAAAENTDYPTELLQKVITRVVTDSNEENNHFIKFNSTRIGIIKACLNRRARILNQKEEIKMSLDKENKNQGYLCGRLLAVLEKVQLEASDTKLNTTIVDSCFSSAHSKPSTVFVRLMDLSNYHFKKLSEGRRIYYKKMINEIMEKLEGRFPQTLNLQDQGSFIVGYYQQNQDLWTSHKDELNNDNNDNNDNNEKEN